MKKISTIAALSATALVLTACANDEAAEEVTTDENTVTVTEDADNTEANDETGAAAASDDANTNDGNQNPLDEQAIESALEEAGYQRAGDDMEKMDGNIKFSVDVDHDSIEGEVDEDNGNTELQPHYDTLLNDVAEAVADQEFEGTDWDEIETWLRDNSNSQDAKTTIGSWELEADADQDGDDNQIQFEIEHIR
ncbi:MAG: hypothetical protein SPJ78_00565 [Corynebacterium camporealensis]|uniref:hypothetical protein n=1 Tax=Corynebacterium camporealensis TaxID=161896 RepID=UPI002A920458|nr:hypothetical protein [Corynebacterium camporealensis]MDY5839205.1 hypothetical protein [Corynebacterium camporealensis]